MARHLLRTPSRWRIRQICRRRYLGTVRIGTSSRKRICDERTELARNLFSNERRSESRGCCSVTSRVSRRGRRCSTFSETAAKLTIAETKAERIPTRRRRRTPSTCASASWGYVSVMSASWWGYVSVMVLLLSTAARRRRRRGGAGARSAGRSCSGYGRYPRPMRSGRSGSSGRPAERLLWAGVVGIDQQLSDIRGRSGIVSSRASDFYQDEQPNNAFLLMTIIWTDGGGGDYFRRTFRGFFVRCGSCCSLVSVCKKTTFSPSKIEPGVCLGISSVV